MLGSNIAHQLGTSLVLVGGAVGEIQTGNVQASQNQLFENFRRVTGRAKGSDDFGATDGHAKLLRFKRQRRLLCRSEEHTSEIQSLMRISYAVFCLKKKKQET